MIKYYDFIHVVNIILLINKFSKRFIIDMMDILTKQLLTFNVIRV